MISSTPSYCQFDPNVIPMQAQVLRVAREADHTLGTHEILLSGSVGCVRESTPILTASGEVPICDINQSDFVLGYRHDRNQFVFQSGSDAFPKGKDYLYRVVHEHGEYVAASHHRLSTYHGVYLPLSDFSPGDSFLACEPHEKKYPFSDQLLSIANVLRYSQIFLNFLDHCAERIRLCDPPLLQDLNTVLESFPLHNDAHSLGQFSYTSKFLHEGDFQELVREHNHSSLLRDPLSKHDFVHLLAKQIEDEEGAYYESKFCEQISQNNQQHLLSLVHNAHPKALLSSLRRIASSLANQAMYYPTLPIKSKVISIEKLSVKEWYWDIQIPNTNNYFAGGCLHHNSAKSILMAHIVIRHCLENSRARVLIGRRALPDLKDTLFTKILEHLEGVSENHYRVNHSTARVRFSNGSEIISRSWADKHYSKLRSLELSMAAIEELTENHGDDEQAYHEIKMRVGRLPHINTPIIVSATNPESPSHWAYKYFILPNLGDKKHLTRHVFYSRTEDNPFLPKSYIDQLKIDMDPKTAERMLYGKWVEVRGETVYYEYDRDTQFINKGYTVDKGHPIILTWDFNIGEGKPMSMCCMQYIQDTFHIFGEVILQSSRTADTLEELDGRGLLVREHKYIVCGDASGKHRDTRSSQSDYDIIRKELSARNLNFEYHVPLANPPVRTRHNRVNAYCKNTLGQTRLYVYKDAPTCDEALRLTKLKPKADYIEDDSKAFQHVGTAIGYAIMFETTRAQRKPQGTILL